MGLALVACVASSIVRNIYKGVEGLRELRCRCAGATTRGAAVPRRAASSARCIDGFLQMRDDVRRFEAELNAQLASNEKVRAALQQSEVFQRSLFAAARVAVDVDRTWTVTSPASIPSPRSSPASAPRRSTASAAWTRCCSPRRSCERVADRFTAALDRHVPAGPAAAAACWSSWARRRRNGRWRARTAARCRCCWRCRRCATRTARRSASLGVATDLTQIKQLEQRLRASELARARGERRQVAFLAAMSHEIRTPMIGVTGMLEVLAHTELDADQRRTRRT